VHHSETGWTAPAHFQGLFEPKVVANADLRRLTPEFDVLLDDISFTGDDEIRGRSMGPAATLGFFFLRDGRREGQVLERLVTWADLFRALDATSGGRGAALRLFSYLLRVAPALSLQELTQRVQSAIPERNDTVTTLAEQLMEEGKQVGRLEGRRETVRRQIELKFGLLASDAIARLECADDASLERYTERVLTAMSIGEVLGE
jgi:hypothetical protein